MSNQIEVYDVCWNEETPCPKCGCRVLKESYATVYVNEGADADYSHGVIIIQCPACDYDVTEIER